MSTNKLESIFSFLHNKSLKNENFKNLTYLIFNKENVLLAISIVKDKYSKDYKTIPTLDNLSINDIIKNLQSIYTTFDNQHKVIIKYRQLQDNSIKPFSLPYNLFECILQQCIKQILEPICEAKFNDNSYGYRPNRTYINAIAKLSTMVNQWNNYFLIDIPIINFFQLINHDKLMRQLWSLGIHDKQFLYYLRQILKHSIKQFQSNKIEYNSDSGIEQCGLLLPLLSNIVLNELDERIENMWCNHYIVNTKFHVGINKNGSKNKSSGYISMRNKSKICEVRFVRYLDQFKLVCTNIEDSKYIVDSISKWINHRLKLSIDQSKIRIADIRIQSSIFLGFKLKAIKRMKGQKFKKEGYILITSIAKDVLKEQYLKLKLQIKRIQKPPIHSSESLELFKYNKLVLDFHNYYKIATLVSMDCRKLSYYINIIIKNRLKNNVSKVINCKLTNDEKRLYGKSKQLRVLKSINKIIYPIGYIQFSIPKNFKKN